MAREDGTVGVGLPFEVELFENLGKVREKLAVERLMIEASGELPYSFDGFLDVELSEGFESVVSGDLQGEVSVKPDSFASWGRINLETSFGGGTSRHTVKIQQEENYEEDEGSGGAVSLESGKKSVGHEAESREPRYRETTFGREGGVEYEGSGYIARLRHKFEIEPDSPLWRSRDRAVRTIESLLSWLEDEIDIGTRFDMRSYEVYDDGKARMVDMRYNVDLENPIKQGLARALEYVLEAADVPPERKRRVIRGWASASVEEFELNFARVDGDYEFTWNFDIGNQSNAVVELMELAGVPEYRDVYQARASSEFESSFSWVGEMETDSVALDLRYESENGDDYVRELEELGVEVPGKTEFDLDLNKTSSGTSGSMEFESGGGYFGLGSLRMTPLLPFPLTLAVRHILLRNSNFS
ncbi:MAG: hypothetical protein ABEK59_05965 [Halobacteria archaeon]